MPSIISSISFPSSSPPDTYRPNFPKMFDRTEESWILHESSNLLKGQMSSTLKYLKGIEELVRRMAQIDDSELIYKGPWIRSAQQRLFQILETDYGFPRATCRSLLNLMRDFLTETFGEELHEGQIVFHAASAAEPPGKSISEIKSVPVHLTFHDRTDMEVLTKEGTAGLRRHKLLRMAHESVDQGGMLIQEDLAVLLCSYRRTIRHDMKQLENPVSKSK